MSFKQSNATTLVADEDVYLAADNVTMVSEGDYRAATLLARAGDAIPPRVAARLKLDESSKAEALVETAPEVTPKAKADAKADAKAKADANAKAAAETHTLSQDEIAGRSTRPFSKPSVR